MSVPAHDSGQQSSVRRGADWLWLTLAVAAGSVLPLFIAATNHALSIPRSDDWSYLRTLFRWDHTGVLDFNGWVSMTLVGQLSAARPVVAIFGDNITAVRVLTATLGAIGLLAVVGTARALGLTTRQGTLVAVCVAASPLWGSLANTFMTDVPAFASQWVAILLAARALRRAPLVRIAAVGALAAGVWAVSIRQYAAVTLAAIIVLFVRRALNDVTIRGFVASTCVASIIGSLAVLVWSSSVPHPLTLAPTVPNLGAVRHAFEALGGFGRIFGLLLLPVIVYVNPVAVVRRSWEQHPTPTRVVMGVAAFVLAGSWFLRPSAPFVGNYLASQGVLADDIVHGTRPDIMPIFAFQGLALIGSLAALVLVAASVPAITVATRSLRRRSFSVADDGVALVVLHLVGAGAAYLGAVLVNFPMFDRYALPALPAVGILLIRTSHREYATTSPRWVVPATGIAVAVALVLGVVYTDEAARYDAARWKVATLATRAGYPVDVIDAGYEWVGFRIGRTPPYRLLGKPLSYRRSVRLRYLHGLCVTVIINPAVRPNGVVASTRSTGLLRDPVNVYAVRLPNVPCGSSSPAAPRA